MTLAPAQGSPPESEDVVGREMDLLLDAVYGRYGFDFRGYASASLRRRLWRRVVAEKTGTLAGLQDELMRDPACMERLLLDMSVNVTSLFRDPSFYLFLREKVIPMLATYPFIRVWNAGCSTGEEAYSMAIMLEEEGLYDRTRIYATDADPGVLQRAKAGVLPIENMRAYTANYMRAGGTRALSEYYTAGYNGARLTPTLGRNITFAQHNLVSDGTFNEFHLIVCRNVMIYFGQELQNHVHSLFYESLGQLGVLALGSKESLRFSPHAGSYEELDAREKLYRRIR